MGRIQLKQVQKKFGDVEVIPPLDLEIEDGEFVVFVDPSGCTSASSATPATASATADAFRTDRAPTVATTIGPRNSNATALPNGSSSIAR